MVLEEKAAVADPGLLPAVARRVVEVVAAASVAQATGIVLLDHAAVEDALDAAAAHPLAGRAGHVPLAHPEVQLMVRGARQR